MTRSSPPSLPGPADSEPASTLPPVPADLALWGDADNAAPKGPVPVFSTNPPTKGDDEMPTIGHIGRYALKYKIGAGGLGTVYAAHDPLLSRLIAIKTLNLEISAEERESFNALFLNEARAAGGLSHPNIVTVFDAGVSQHGGDNSAYIAMELLKGRDLRQLRQEGWRPTPAQAALIVRRVADALAYAHSKGVVHRDVKPANIFMVGRTQPRVLDFGIARVAHQHESGASGDVAAGSPYYMAPEQARHQTVDRRADVFSLGVVLYELLTDQKPFRGSTLSEITEAVLDHQPPLANSVDPAVPAALAEIAARAMVKDPEQRYRSARSLSRDLRHWLDENAAAGEGAAAEPEPPRGSRALVWAGAAIVALGLVSIGLWAGLAANREAEPTSAAPLPGAAEMAAAAAPRTSMPAVSRLAAPDAGASGATAFVAPAVQSAVKVPVAVAGVTVPPPAAPPIATTRPVATPPATAPAPTQSARARRTREAKEREAHAAAVPAIVALGTVRIAVSPWGNVEVDGTAVGTTPPLNELTLSEGHHQVTVRNADFPPYSTSINVVPGQPVTLRHRFGS